MDLLDWMAGQALAGLCANPGYAGVGDLTECAYDYASAMLAEKARREADHSGDANKMVQGPTAADNERWARFQDGIRIAFSPTGGWLAEIREGSMSYGDTIADAVANLRARWEERNAVPESAAVDHSPDAGKVVKLEALNRELVEALKACEYAFSKFAPQEESAYGMAWIKARAALAKAKGVA